MRVFLTGASGYIGGAVGRKLLEAGHDVVGLARSDESAATISAEGMEVARGDIENPGSLDQPCRDADAVIHTATTGNEGAGRADAGAVDAILDAVQGTNKPFVYTSGVWVLGDTGNARAGEEFRADPPAIVEWRLEVEETVRNASGRDIRTTVVRPGVVYGDGGGMLAGMVRSAASEGVVRVVGDGGQIWSLVHVDDLAELYRLLLGAEGGSSYNAASVEYEARDVALGACLAVGGEGDVVAWDPREARDAMGLVAEALAMSQRVDSSMAEEVLGWRPAGPSPLEELVRGSYARGVSPSPR